MIKRREFLQGSVILGCVVVVGRTLLARAAGPTTLTGAELMSRMTWLNDPASATKDGDQLVVRSRAKTDFWRQTTTGTIMDNGHFFHLSVSSAFVFQARVNGQFAAEFDQAGLMVRLNPENWMKCGTELFAGHRRASVVFTREFSDWSTMLDLSEAAPVWWRVIRKHNSIQVLYSLDGKDFTFVRDGYFEPEVKVDVGILCAAPTGPGFEAVFDHLQLE